MEFNGTPKMHIFSLALFYSEKHKRYALMNYYKKTIAAICIVFYNQVGSFWNNSNCFGKHRNAY